MSTREETTQGIRISVRTKYCAEESAPDAGHWLFFYTITISNESSQTVKLMNRHWIITDGNGKTQEVKGEGVIGQQPVIHPGEAFEYTSACPLSTEVGAMYGTYLMLSDNNETFSAHIPPFTLSLPHRLH